MNVLNVKASAHSYEVIIDENIRFNLKDYLPKDYSSILIITDENVAPLYLADVTSSLQDFTVYEAIIPSGEASKDIEHFYQLQTVAITKGLDRNSLIIALGGGVVGDLAGFVASSYMRGIDYIQVPTTILSHDSSVGGKVAINHQHGKNMIGAFFPPQAVVYDVTTLDTLPEHEVRSGYAELIKEAFIADEAFLTELFKTEITKVSNDALVSHLFNGIKIKANIVEKDERESYLRKFLNFGHTLAHALEAELGYGKITHGEAVAVGMLFALRVSENKYEITLPYEAYFNWLKMNDYPISLFDVNIERIVQLMKSDKKSQNQTVQMVLLTALAKPDVVELTDTELLAYLESFKEELKSQ